MSTPRSRSSLATRSDSFQDDGLDLLLEQNVAEPAPVDVANQLAVEGMGQQDRAAVGAAAAALRSTEREGAESREGSRRVVDQEIRIGSIEDTLTGVIEYLAVRVQGQDRRRQRGEVAVGSQEHARRLQILGKGRPLARHGAPWLAGSACRCSRAGSKSDVCFSASPS